MKIPQIHCREVDWLDILSKRLTCLTLPFQFVHLPVPIVGLALGRLGRAFLSWWDGTSLSPGAQDMG